MLAVMRVRARASLMQRIRAERRRREGMTRTSLTNVRRLTVDGQIAPLIMIIFLQMYAGSVVM
jgi:hypothetical protein